MEEQVILVDEQDNPVGMMEKIEAHEKALLHRAFSVFVFNKQGELMLQQRAKKKYHSPLLWTNTCCSHQRKGETNIEAGKRRLQEEMGFSCDLEEVFSFIYKAPFDNGLTEHELDHVMVGKYEDSPLINDQEVEAFKWMPLKEVKEDIENKPELYTEWFKIIFRESYEKISKYI
ncbi:isopentenyl-diphosphate delta-isomerase [Tenacibaculum sp. MAR_2009_124]|uniref:isopentenyl-diphosphate Delta-isomerase n=1 Tax=Tenacibaculum sp. MAR_2009_124 TaxID=1250059 RepID=UPI000896A779|nr:isopentenyl-diphosphate Delta-isomerase [Tenacibaculum sp. MAR_2009_124]SEC90980.1 isopentenyl-diphosphate delta-isomerase [Tenacibaculum sp. MAR_2009_124]